MLLGWCRLCSDRGGDRYGLSVYRSDKQRRCNNTFVKPDRSSVTLCAGTVEPLKGEHADAIDAAYRLGGMPAAHGLWVELGRPLLGERGTRG